MLHLIKVVFIIIFCISLDANKDNNRNLYHLRYAAELFVGTHQLYNRFILSIADQKDFNDSGQDRRKRSSSSRAAHAAPMIAENMIVSAGDVTDGRRAGTGGRFKRGITADDIEAWLESQAVAAAAAEERNRNEPQLGDILRERGDDERPEYGDGDYYGNVPNDVDGEDEEFPYEPVQPQSDFDDDDDDVIEREPEVVGRAASPEITSELARELLAEKAEDKVRDAVLEYLIDEAEAEEEEQEKKELPETEEEEKREPVEGSVEPGVGYVPIVFGGVPGIFIPEVLPNPGAVSAAEGRRKRNQFYPSYYEPYGGRWSALTPRAGPDAGEVKRAADGYGRLYRLADALRRYDSYSE